MSGRKKRRARPRRDPQTEVVVNDRNQPDPREVQMLARIARDAAMAPDSPYGPVRYDLGSD